MTLPRRYLGLSPSNVLCKQKQLADDARPILTITSAVVDVCYYLVLSSCIFGISEYPQGRWKRGWYIWRHRPLLRKSRIIVRRFLSLIPSYRMFSAVISQVYSVVYSRQRLFTKRLWGYVGNKIHPCKLAGCMKVTTHSCLQPLDSVVRPLAFPALREWVP